MSCRRDDAAGPHPATARRVENALLDAATQVHDGDLRGALSTAEWAVRELRQMIRDPDTRS